MSFIAATRPRAIAEIGESGATVPMGVYYNRAEHRAAERRLRRMAKKRRRGFWKFPPAVS